MTMRFIKAFGLVVLAALTAGRVAAASKAEPVHILIKAVGPVHNPSESYDLYEKLPYCRPKTVEHVHTGLGEVLHGEREIGGLFPVNFRERRLNNDICRLHLKEEEINAFKKAIDDRFFIHMELDKLSFGTFVGYHLPRDDSTSQVLKPKYYLATHFVFMIEYNGKQIISVNVTGNMPGSLQELPESDGEVEFMYSVEWISNKDVSYDDRLDYIRTITGEENIAEFHWLPLLNSLLLVLMLLGFLSTILVRVVRADIMRYASKIDLEFDSADPSDAGWKLVHGDVFRFPENKMLLAACLGVGTQFVAVGAVLLFLGSAGYFQLDDGSSQTTALALYGITSGLAGYVSASYYRQLEGTLWTFNIIVTSILFVVPFGAVWAIVNTIAIVYGSTQALPFEVIMYICSGWLFCAVPLTIVGGIAGRRLSRTFEAPCRTRNVPREIPPISGLRIFFTHYIAAGFLPFCSISVELYYLFSIAWGSSVAIMYGILALSFFLSILVSCCVSVTLTYFQLTEEDYRWWWRSFLSGGSAAYYVFAYSWFYFNYFSEMDGFFQSTIFFGYVLVFCFIIFLSLGSMSFFASLWFVKFIFKSFKSD